MTIIYDFYIIRFLSFFLLALIDNFFLLLLFLHYWIII